MKANPSRPRRLVSRCVKASDGLTRGRRSRTNRTEEDRDAAACARLARDYVASSGKLRKQDGSVIPCPAMESGQRPPWRKMLLGIVFVVGVMTLSRVV